jgi:putative RNA 2'-phosphotransferase
LNNKKLSKFVSLVLRHEPHRHGLILDPEGWVLVADLLSVLRTKKDGWPTATDADLAQMMAASDKARFEMGDGRIRALYGHSVPLKVIKDPTPPPIFLYHGTSQKAAQVIAREGLRPMKRQYVHLSSDEETAHQVGCRKALAPVMLRVLAQQAAAQGHLFYHGNDTVWLADTVPACFIEFPADL